jgi:PadR family transcriptional regulator PadR
MKGSQLGEFEELVLLSVGILNGEAYGINVLDTISEQTGRKVTVSSCAYCHVSTWRKRDLLSRIMVEPRQQEEGGRSGLYKITQGWCGGSLAEAKAQREAMWSLLPDFSFNYG